MSKQRWLAVSLALAAAALAATYWLALRPRSAERAAERGPAAAPHAAPTAVEPEPAVSATAAAESAAGGATESRRAVRFDEATSVRVEVALPAGTPADESIELFAASFSLAELGSGEALEQALDEYRARRVKSFEALARGDEEDRGPSSVHEIACERAADGSFVAVFDPGATRGALSLRSRYAYVDGGIVTVDLPATKVRIEPELGAWFTARLRPPQALQDDVDLAALAPFQARLFGWRIDASGGGNVALAAEVGPGLEFELGGVPPGYRYFFQVDPGAFVPVFDSELTFEAGQHVDRDFPLALGVRVDGIVVDPDGAAVAGARVVASSDAARLGRSDRDAQTDAEGRFALRGIAAGEMSISAQRDGYAAAKVAGLRGADGQRLSGIVLRLERGLTLRGRVAWPDGSPAAGAEVSTAELDPSGAGRGEGWSASRSFADTTDADGRFARSGLVGPSFSVRAEAERDGRTWTALAKGVGAATEVALTLAEPHAVRGRVVDDLGAPLSSFAIESSRTDVGFGDPEFRSERQDFDAREDGRFELDLSAGAWRLSASASRHAESAAALIEVPHTGAEIVLTAPRCAVVQGVVVDPGGAAVAGARVRASDSVSPRGWSGEEKHATADAEGRFAFSDLEPGGVTLSASADGWAPSAPLDLSLAAGETQAALELALRRGGRLEGEIYTSAGAPDPGRRILVGNITGGMSLGGNATSDAAGRFAIEAIAPGTYQVIAEPRLSAMSDANPADVLASLKMQSVEIREGETTHVVLGAPPKAPVRLHGLVTRSSEPVRRGMVMAILEGAPVLSSMKMAAIGADGRYEVTLDEPGEYTLVVGDSMGDADGVEFHETIPAREEHRLDLALPNGRVLGRVLASDGGPLEGIEVGIEREGEVSLFSIAEGHTQRTDSDGRFEFSSLAPGRYRLRAPRSRGAFFGGEERRWGIAVRTGLALDSGATIDGVELVLSAPGSIAGVVRDSEGKPVPRATIYVRSDSGEVLNPVSGCTSDATGRFEFGGASAGTYTVSARAGALASRESGPVRVVEGQSSEVELKLEPGTLLRVTVEDEAGARVRAAVRVLDENGRDVGRLHGLDALEKLLSEGLSSTEQRFGPLPAGKYRVIATGPAGESVNKPVTLTGQEERSLRIKLKD